jgi:hypothetical protein
MVFVPELNPFAGLTTTLLSVATPLVTTTVPKVVPPIENVTLPVMVPAIVVELTEAANEVVPPDATEAGATASVVAVAAEPVTVSVVVQVEDAKLAFPPYVAVRVFAPALNPFAALTVTLLSVAHPPVVTVAVPKVVVPTVNVTVPTMVPAVEEVTNAVNVAVPASVTEAGAAVSVVLVAVEPVAVSVVLAVEIP